MARSVTPFVFLTVTTLVTALLTVSSTTLFVDVSSAMSFHLDLAYTLLQLAAILTIVGTVAALVGVKLVDEAAPPGSPPTRGGAIAVTLELCCYAVAAFLTVFGAALQARGSLDEYESLYAESEASQHMKLELAAFAGHIVTIPLLALNITRIVSWEKMHERIYGCSAAFNLTWLVWSGAMLDVDIDVEGDGTSLEEIEGSEIVTEDRVYEVFVAASFFGGIAVCVVWLHERFDVLSANRSTGAAIVFSFLACVLGLCGAFGMNSISSEDHTVARVLWALTYVPFEFFFCCLCVMSKFGGRTDSLDQARSQRQSLKQLGAPPTGLQHRVNSGEVTDLQLGGSDIGEEQL